MGNILLITERPKSFSSLAQLFQKDSFNVIYKKYDLFNQKKASDIVYDFVLYDLLPCFEENIKYLSLLAKHGTVPVYAIGENIPEIDAIRYYEAGTNGVIRLPYSELEFKARIISIIKLLEKTARIINKVKFGPLEIDLHNRILKKQDKILKLTNVESKILRVLLQNKNTVVDKDTLIHYAWDDTDSATDNALGIHIARLRNKIEYHKERPVIDTIWGIGYRLNYHEEC